MGVLVDPEGGDKVTQAFLPVVLVDALGAAGTDRNVCLTFCKEN